MARTFSSGKRIAIPWRVANTISNVPSVTPAPISASSLSEISIAFTPALRGLANASSVVFLIIPLRVAITMNFSAENSRTRQNDAIGLLFAHLSTILTIGFPLAILPPTGISCTFTQ